MKAAWYEQQGAARDVLKVGEMPTPTPSAGEVRIRIMASGINPGDIKKRQNAFNYGMPYPRIIPHSDGAGVIDGLGAGVATEWLGQRVWCYGAQTYRPFGTAAEYTVVPLQQVVALPDQVSFSQGACLGIPSITAYQAVQLAGPLQGRSVLVHGGAGVVSRCAIQLAARAGAIVIATIRTAADAETVRRAGASHVVLRNDQLVEQIQALSPTGIDHIIDLAFGSNIAINEQVLAIGGSIAAYATDISQPQIPFWPLLFKNAHICLVGSDDLSVEIKAAAAKAITAALVAGWSGFELITEVRLDEIAQAHELIEQQTQASRIVLQIA